MKNNASKGFTLLEMAIVLVIIGTITAAILFGRNLLLASKMQTVITDVDSFTSAVNNFQQTYKALPGDFPGATALWGAAGGGNGDNYTASCAATQGTGTQTCNGNGSGKLGTSGSEYEIFRFWQHLYNAGLFSQSLSGVPGSGGVIASSIGVNTPPGPLKGSGYSVLWVGTTSGAGQTFDGSYANVITFGGPVSASIPNGPILTAEQAAAIDSKMDDGMPGTGNVRAYKSTSTITPNCTTTAVTTTAAYNVASTSLGPLCSLTFVKGF